MAVPFASSPRPKTPLPNDRCKFPFGCNLALTHTHMNIASLFNLAGPDLIIILLIVLLLFGAKKLPELTCQGIWPGSS